MEQEHHGHGSEAGGAPAHEHAHEHPAGHEHVHIGEHHPPGHEGVAGTGGGDTTGKMVLGIAILIAALIISASVFLSAGMIISAKSAQGSGSDMQSIIDSAAQAGGAIQNASAAQAGGSGQQAQAQAAAGGKSDKIVLDFLHADWCPHCQAMKPIVADLQKQLPADRFTVRSWNEKDRSTDTATKAVYDDYTSKGYFVGFPTFVVNGQASTAGEMSASDFKSWICSQYSSPLPTACA